MALLNRDKDQSEQREVYNCNLNSVVSAIAASAGLVNIGVGTGLTFPLCTIPFPAQLMAVEEAAWGLSGAPVHSWWIYRFAGGFTSIAVGQTWTVTAYGTSGAWGQSLFGASWLLQTGDQVVLYTQGANTAVASSQHTVVVKALQDIKTDFGV